MKSKTIPFWVWQPDGLALVEFLNGFWHVIAFWNGKIIIEFQGGDAK